MVQEKSDVALTAFSRRVESIEKMNVDWSQWDDSYQFVQDQNTNFIETNLIDETLQISNLNLILYFDESGYIVFKKSLSLGGLGDTTTPAEVFKHTNSDKINIKEIIKNGEQVSGFLYTTIGTFLFAVSPVTTSDGVAPPKGAMLMARYINDSDVEELRQSTGFDLDILETSNIERFHTGVTLQALEKGPVVIEDKDNLMIYTLARDSWGHPAKIISIKHKISGIEYALSLTLLLTGISVFLSAIFSQFVSRIIYRKNVIITHKK
jgi:sensor domain CHASE-containing protein